MNTDFDPFEEPRAPIRGRRDRTTGRPSSSRFSAKTGFLAVMIALGILIGAIWSLYPSGPSNEYSENVPIVRAESKPLKVIPEDAGGMEIPHRDSTVFSALRPDEEERPRIENLLAKEESEEPIPRSQLFAGLNTETEEAPEPEINNSEVTIVEEIGREPTIVRPEKIIPFDTQLSDENIEEIVETGEDKKEIILPVEPMKKPDIALENKEPVIKERKLTEVVDNVLGEVKPAAEPKKEEVPAVKPKSEPVKPKEEKPVASGIYYVQLASLKTRLAAESEWSKLRAKYSLSSAYRIQQKDLGAKGIYYRIQAGPYSKSTANSICSKIKLKSPGACLVTK